MCDEDRYRNLDDENKHFLLLMMGDFHCGMLIPEEVVPRLKGEILGKIHLETRNGSSHTMVLAKYQEKRVLTLGWDKFVEIYDLHMDDSVILQYSGNSKFNVIIFDKLGREKALSVVVDPFISQDQNRRSDAHEIGSAKNMGASGGRFKSYLEYHYMNLDDVKKYFSMLMMGDFQHEMIIPEEFVKRFKGEIPGEIILETKNRCIYIIGVAKHQEKLVLTAGWGTFVQTFGLQMGDTIVLRYNGNSKFDVIIFDKLGCENARSVVVDPSDLDPVQERHTSATETVNRSNIRPQSAQVSPAEFMKTSHALPQPMEMQPSSRRVNRPPMESPPTKRQRRLQKEQLKDGYITTYNTKLTPSQQQKVKEKVQSRHSEIPIVVSVMNKYNVVSRWYLTFPSHYAKKYLGGDDPRMNLRVLDQKYALRFGEAPDDKRLKGGWKRFVQGNNLKMGDICLFELLSGHRIRTMEVYIIPVNDGN